MNKENIIIKIAKGDTNEEQKIRQDAFNIRKEVFLKQGRGEEFIFDKFDYDKETSFLTCYIKNEDGNLKPVGSIRNFIDRQDDKLVGRASKIAVLSDYRNNGSANIKGIADNLLKASENITIEKINKPELLYLMSTASAVKFYERLGYSGTEKVPVSEEPNFLPATRLYKRTPNQLNKLDFKVEKCLTRQQEEQREQKENNER